MESAGFVSSDGGHRIIRWWSPYHQMVVAVSPDGGRRIIRWWSLVAN